MKLFFFGTPARQIFGACHSPQAGARLPHGVILCYPMGQEAIWSHRAFRQLCDRLTRTGLHALRFDYYGCGDSAGESSEGDAHQWMADIDLAIETMRTSQALARISLIGLRLGATLAALLAARRSDVENLVLWEPILDGKIYIEDELAGHQAWMKHGLPKHSGPSRRSNEVPEIEGFPLTDAMRSTIGEMNLLSIRRPPARRVLTIEREATDDARRLQRHLAGLDIEADYEEVPGPKIWKWVPQGHAVVPPKTLERITEWLTGVDQ